MENQVEPQFKPEILEKLRKSTHYKWKYQLFKRIAIGLAFLLAVSAYCLCMALKGNHTLKVQLEDSKIIRIMPNGRIAK